MAYSTSAPPVKVAQGVGGPNLFLYVSTDVHTDVDAAGYFTNGWDLGMRVNDVVIVVKSTATVGATVHCVSAVTTGGAATIAPAILA
jgi:Fe-S cluster assembly scaffold protein SufB